jgi:hypothetical protein
LDDVEVGVGDGELLRRPGKCRDVVAGGERLLDQLSAGGAGGAEDGEVLGFAPIGLLQGEWLAERVDEQMESSRDTCLRVNAVG